MRSYSILAVAVKTAAFVFAFATMCQAQVYFDDFDDLNDDGWDHYDPLGGGTFTFPDGAYQLSTTAPEVDTYGQARISSTVTGETVTDFQISVDLLTWDETLPQTFGIIARVDNIGLGTSDGYLFSYSPGESAGRTETALAVERLDDEEIASGGSRHFLDGDLTPGDGYRMTFTGIGDQLTGSIYALSDLNTALGSVTLTDDTYQQGSIGLLVADSNVHDLQGATATFDNYSLTAVPEPASVALLTGLAGALAIMIRRRR